ncbi:MAG: dUTP diphosphatase [Gemmatimonadetes bacterium]|nr:dUTP diphosphatase [Gemmatimonadota bacterium]
MQISRVDPSLPLPRHQTPGSVGFDLLCRKDVVVPPGEIRLVPVNLIVAVPPGYMLLLAARSSLPHRKGLMVPNGVGIVDQDYRGPNDEIHVQVYNFTDSPVNVRRRERLAQGIFVRVVQADWDETEHLGAADRGGFGSTGQE